ncbi:MAG: SDR family oxidoreductase [Candidatus Omnitrophica bacterium]|jgi:NAD(P)-dependent dehydrogenase (short-subunit alcohol dehydrogenase family)|nr:SDR family oxidoreductase [Candidatus Omnitrophota bacterium]
MRKRTAIIISVSSDIGSAMALRWATAGWKVFGTYRTYSAILPKLTRRNVKLVPCDLASVTAINKSVSDLKSLCGKWDVLVLCPGSQDPIGPFMHADFEEWEASVKVNFTSQVRIVRALLPLRNIPNRVNPCVLFFAGGGTNNAPVNYSAYIVSKIALIKMCELLDSEIKDTNFTIIGPGWVKTKIHNSTMDARGRAGANYKRTIDKLSGKECTPMKQVLDCCDWLISSSREVVSGRNFSVVFDKWGSKKLENFLRTDDNIYKLRRFGNDLLKNNLEG